MNVRSDGVTPARNGALTLPSEGTPAYETLSDHERRREYDASMRRAVIPRGIEPLTFRRSEPMFSPRVPRSSRAVDVWTYHEHAVDELFRTLERLFWDF